MIRLNRGSDDDQKLGNVLKSEAALCIDLGSSSKPVSRLKTLQAVKKAFEGAQQYRRSLEAYEEDVAEYAKKLEEWVKKKETDKKTGEDKKERPKNPAAEDDELPDSCLIILSLVTAVRLQHHPGGVEHLLKALPTRIIRVRVFHIQEKLPV